MNLQQLDGIKWSQYDEQQDLLLVWYGGHGIHAYSDDGAECCFWNLGGGENPTIEQVQKNISEHIKEQDYLELY